MPQLSANDEEGTILKWFTESKSKVVKGDLIGEIETTKSVSDVYAEMDGYVFFLGEEGTEIKVGDPMLIIGASVDLNIDECLQAPKLETRDKKWTKKAEILAKKNNISIEDILFTGELIKEEDILDYLDGIGDSAAKSMHFDDFVKDIYPSNKERILVIGGGNGAVIVSDIIMNSKHQEVVGFIDDNTNYHGKSINGVKILGSLPVVDELWEKNRFDKLIIGFSAAFKSRIKLFDKLTQKGIPFANVIDSNVVIHRNVQMGTGNIIFSNCRIGACSIIGDNNFISAFTNIEHHNKMGNHCTFGPMVSTSGSVLIADKVKFGTGIFIEPDLKIGDNSIISSGSIITSNIPSFSIVKSTIKNKIKPINSNE